MADTKITALAAITTVDPAADVLPIVDISDTSMAASGTTKKITSNQILGAGGTATLASATITGDLTVDTSTLKVDSANNRVGVNNATPGVAFHIGTTSGTNKFCINTAFTSGGDIQMRRGSFIGFSNAADNANSEYMFANGGALEFGISGTTAMTLNSTGLGMGMTPSEKLSVKTGDIYIHDGAAGSNTNIGFKQSGNVKYRFRYDVNADSLSLVNTAGSFAITFDQSANVAIGNAAVATTATDGFLYIPSCAGAPTGTPTAKTGRTPMVVDSTNNRFYVYVNGAWKYATLT